MAARTAAPAETISLLAKASEKHTKIVSCPAVVLTKLVLYFIGSICGSFPDLTAAMARKRSSVAGTLHVWQACTGGSAIMIEQLSPSAHSPFEVS